jgi:hypothetical protein
MYLYAISDRPGAPVPPCVALEGMDGDPICLISIAYRGIAAVVDPLAAAGRPTEDNLWRHEAVVEALMAEQTVLPVRFGTLLADEAAVQAALAAHYDEFVADLRRLSGKIELGLRVLWEEAAPASQVFPVDRSARKQGRGRAYVMTRLEQERQVRAWRQRAEAAAAEIQLPLAEQAFEATCRVLITPRTLLTAAYLVDREQVPSFHCRVDMLSSDHPSLHFLYTGPWPPYSFVTVGRPPGASIFDGKESEYVRSGRGSPGEGKAAVRSG